jgi:hypothetical protein
MHYIENNQTFPSNEDLLPHLHAEHLEHRLALGALEAEGEVALGWRSEFLYRERFNLSAGDSTLVADDPGVPGGPVALGGPFAVAWKNYMKSVFKKGFMYRLSCSPSVVLYISENKTLAGKEDRAYEGEASGRKLVMTFFEDDGKGLVQRVDRTSLALKQQRISLAELLHTLRIPLPPDADRTAANTELLLETHYQNLEVQRFVCTSEPAADDVHKFSLESDVNAETAFALELGADHRTKMVLARCLQRNDRLLDEETLHMAWNSSLVQLQARTAMFFPAPAVPLAGRGRGRGEPPVGRGRGRGRGR